MEATLADPVTGLTPAPAGGQPPFSFAAAPTAPGFDVADLLPPAAQERLRALRLRAKESHAIVPPYEDIRQASMARTNAENALKRLLAPAGEGGFRLKPDDRRVIEATKALDKATDEFLRLQERQADRGAAFQAVSQAVANVEAWLRDGRPSGTVLEAVDVDPPKLLKNEDVLSGIERLRRRGRELKATLHVIRSASYPSSHARAKMRAKIEALAMQGAPDVSVLLEHDGELVWPMSRVQSDVFAEQRSLAFAQVPDALALTCWLHKDALITALDREIASEADDAASLSHEERQRREAEVMGDLLSVERDESALVWRAMDEKLPVEHRADISPLALLGVALVTPPRADAPRTSADHAYDIVLGGRR
jgi:hypothetical protein